MGKLTQTPIQSDTIAIKLNRPISIVTIKVGRYYNGVFKETTFERELDFTDYSIYKFEYFPSDSWYEFNTESKRRIIKLKNYKQDHFEVHKGKYKWIYHRK